MAQLREGSPSVPHATRYIRRSCRVGGWQLVHRLFENCLGCLCLGCGSAASSRWSTGASSHVQAVSATMTNAQVAAVTILHAGSTMENVLATRLARASGAPAIGITRIGRSPLQRHCDVLLHPAAAETRDRPEAMSSRMAQFAIVDTHVRCYALPDARQTVRDLKRSM